MSEPGPPVAASGAVVTGRIEEIRRRIALVGDVDAVTVVAVTKGFGADAVAAARMAGLDDLGESYAPELVEKAEAAAAAGGHGVRWHFIGRLQSNKVRRLAGTVHLWQSVDRPSVVAELARHAPGASILVQVNVSGEPQKGGCEPVDAGGFVADVRAAGLDVRGLMCIGAPGGDEAARPGFRLLRSLADDLGLAERSMGMTGDLTAAVEEGSTMVRLGTALFGARPGPRSGPTGLRH